MEAMGGTGDTLTGIVAALSGTGMDISDAALVASTVNRLAGVYAHPTPATQVAEIIRYIPQALKNLREEDQCKTAIGRV
jgi:NAD(P)H-hydrate repair Nnr-like enzyme with NAD(P)H-hydrate dehydratase domain